MEVMGIKRARYFQRQRVKSSGIISCCHSLALSPLLPIIFGDLSMYWDINKTLSYNKLFNFVIGNRGSGKTYGSKVWCINRYLKTGEQFIYLRRYDTEAKKVGPTFFSSISNIYPDKKLKYFRGELLIDEAPCGYIMALTKSADIKSLDYPRVETIIFDEFLLERGIHHYIKDEVKFFLNFYETIARMRDVRVLFLANSTSLINPYFKYFGITLPFGSKFNSGEEWLIELVANQEFIAAKKQTRFSKLIKDTDYEKYSVENKFVYDVKSFVEKKRGNCKYCFSMVYENETYGVWTNRETRLCYVDKDYQDSCKFKLGFRVDDFQDGIKMVTNPGSDNFFRFLLMHYKNGTIRFGDIQTKEIFVKIANIK